MWFLLLACVDGGGAGKPDAGGTEPSGGDTGTSPPTWTPLPATCAAPDELPPTPWERTGGVDAWEEGVMMELVDLEVVDGQAWGVGQGGLWVLDVADPAHPTTQGYSDPGYERYHRVETLGNGWVAATHRDQGFRVLHAADPSRQRVEYAEIADGMEGLHLAGDRLYLTSREEGLLVYDIRDPAHPERINAVSGLSLPWEVAGAGDGWAYVADTELGVVPVSLAEPDAPALQPAVDLDAPAFHVTVTEPAVYVAAAGDGVVVLDRANPAAPTVTDRLPTGGSTWMTAVDGEVLYAVDHEALTAWSLADPLHPTPLTRVPTDLHALAVDAADGVAWLGAWSRVEGYRVDPTLLAGAVDVALDTVGLRTGEVAEVQVANRGGGALTLAGATLEGVEGTVEVDRLVVAPGESATLRITPAGSVPDPLSGSLCLATDDPAAPLTEVGLESGVVHPPLGEPAPDFTLTDLEGNAQTLSAQRGHPVLLVYFATW